MANENLIVPVLDGDYDSDAEEMLEIDENTPEPSLEEQLDTFRQEWHRELGKGGPSSAFAGAGEGATRSPRGRDETMRASNASSQNSSPTPDAEKDLQLPSLTETVEEKAKYLFRQGVRQERIGKMYEAVMFYKQAMQLVPDVENRVQESEANSRTGSNQVSDDEENNNDVEETMNHAEDNLDNDIDGLDIELQAMTTNDLKSPCHPNTSQTATHISVLPLEVILYIFRWVVTPDLDLRALEQLSRVCRGFYVCARDGSIWRKACIRIWGKVAYLTKEYSSWRQMYVERPHPRFNGIYISRVTYVRHGEPSMDTFYRPWHLVEYHRFLRVFTDGTILFVSSADDPQSVVSKMHSNCSLSGKTMGRYCIVGDVLTAVLEKEKVKEIDVGRRFIRHRPSLTPPESEQTFHMELRIRSYGNRPNVRLEWRHYACHTRYKSTGNVTVTEFDMNHQFYPFCFSRVKSYARFCEAPL